MERAIRNPRYIVNRGHRLIAPVEIRFETRQFPAPAKRLGHENDKKHSRASRHYPVKAKIGSVR